MPIELLKNGELASNWRQKLNSTISFVNEAIISDNGWQGPEGPRGIPGKDGAKGDPGNYTGVTLTSIVNSIEELPAAGTTTLGVAYGVMNGEDINLWINTATGWVNYGPIASEEERNVPYTIFVTPDGNDDRDGRTFGKSLRSLETAVLAATQLAGNVGPSIPGSKNEPTLVLVYPGIYKTKGELAWPDRCTVYGVGGARKTVVIPADPDIGGRYEQKNVFLLGDAGYVEGFSFEGFQIGNPAMPDDPFEDPTKGFAIAFRPGAIINRVPYAHNITAYTPFPPRSLISAPMNFKSGNPLVGVGGGVAIADGSVISAYSAFPNIMTWGATPSTPNGVGYHARNGGMLNPINAICIWAHKHFMVTGGAQMVLSGCSSQFGDYSLWSQGFSQSPVPAVTTGPLVVDSVAAIYVDTNLPQLKDLMWAKIQNDGWCGCPCPQASDEIKRQYSNNDITLLFAGIKGALQSGTQRPVDQWFRGMHRWNGQLVFAAECTNQYVLWWEYIVNEFKKMLPIGNILPETPAMLDGLVGSLRAGMLSPERKLERSLLTAINHQWTQPLAGVTRDSVPSRFRNSGKASRISRSIRTLNGGRVRYSGQDDEGNAVFVGGLRIDARSGELQGPPFDAAVRNRAIRTSLSRSF